MFVFQINEDNSTDKTCLVEGGGILQFTLKCRMLSIVFYGRHRRDNFFAKYPPKDTFASEHYSRWQLTQAYILRLANSQILTIPSHLAQCERL